MKIVFRFLAAIFIAIFFNIIAKAITVIIIYLWWFPNFRRCRVESKELFNGRFYESRIFSITQYYYQTFWDFVKGNSKETQEYKDFINGFLKT